MTTADMQKAISRIVDNEYGLSGFAVLRQDDNTTLVKFVLDDILVEKVKQMLEGILHNRYLTESTELDSAENIADNRKVLYEIEQSDTYSPFAFLNTYNNVHAEYSETNVEQLMGWAFMLNLNDTAIWIYQQVNYPQLIKRSRNIYAMLSGNKVYTTLDRDVIKVEDKIDCVIIGTSIITANINLLQRSFQFESYVRGEAKKTIALISSMDIVDGLERFIALGNRKALTNAKKIVKARHSPVLRMEKPVLLEKLSLLPRYKDKFEISDGKIKIGDQKQAIEFIKMLNDSILKSELTEAEYDSDIKTELAPIEDENASR